MQSQKPVVLFLSSDNSVRSQMAEALLRQRAGDRYEARSAGLSPTSVHPLVHRVLEEVGIDTSGLKAKSVMQFLARMPVAHALILCEEGPGSPRIYPFAPSSARWPFPEPELTGSDEEAMKSLRALREALSHRIQEWQDTQPERVNSSAQSLSPPATHAPVIS